MHKGQAPDGYRVAGLFSVERPERRVANRSRMVMGVRLSGMEVGESGALVYTLDVSASGAKLGGLHKKVEEGDILILHRQLRRAKCKVMWVKEVAKDETQVGVQLMDADANFWGLELFEDRAQGKASAKNGSTQLNVRATASGKGGE